MVSLKGKNYSIPNKETYITSIVDPSVHIQTSADLASCPPPWFGEVVLVAAHLKKQGSLAKLCERVQFARRRFGRYDVVDFLVVQIALCHQRRAYPGSVLQAAPARSYCFHGASFSGTSCPLVQHSRAFERR